jgi:hypothetical protein
MVCNGDVCGSVSYFTHHPNAGNDNPRTVTYTSTSLPGVSGTARVYLGPPPVQVITRTPRVVAPHQAVTGSARGGGCAPSLRMPLPAGTCVPKSQMMTPAQGQAALITLGLTIINALQLGLDPVTDTAEGAAIGADAAEFADQPRAGDRRPGPPRHQPLRPHHQSPRPHRGHPHHQQPPVLEPLSEQMGSCKQTIEKRAS